MIGRRWRLVSLISALSTGALLGATGFTFHYAQGHSYFSKDPASCINCHIMQTHYDSWLKSSHHAVATCADCHLPHDLVPGLIAKADNGFFHSWAFTFQDFHEPIQIKPRNLRILEQNCRYCHGELVSQMEAYHQPLTTGDGVSCLQCHSAVGHTTRPR